MTHAIHDQVLAFLSNPDEVGFEDLALAVYRHQFESIAAYRRVCERRGDTPDRVRDWRDIPPVPALAFKQVDLCCGPPERIFLSSGTTRGTATRSRHAMPDLRLYHASALGGLRRHLFPDVARMRILSLIPRATEAPRSSLAQMVDWAIEELGAGGSETFCHPDRLDLEGLTRALRDAERSGEPACLMTTTAALIHFFDYCRDHSLSFRLSHGSRLMDTGGAKGAPRTLSRKGLLQAIWNSLAIPGYHVVNEYGMSELSSQYYDNVLRDRWAGRVSHRAKVGPPWLRTRILDPGTLRDVPSGDTGLLCHVDLANAGSALVVLTEDLGRATPHGFEILGRVAGAEARGCSLALAELLADGG